MRRGIIVAAGYGTRLRPITQAIPKELLPLINTPSIALIVDEFVQSGIVDILIIIAPHKEAIAAYFNEDSLCKKMRERGVTIQYVYQTAMRGTGDALRHAESFINGEPVVIAYPDDIHLGKVPLTAQLITRWKSTACAVLATIENPPDLHRYGVVQRNSDGIHIDTIVEKPQPHETESREASIGRFILPPQFFSYLEEGWARHSSEAGEYFHTYALQRLMDEGMVVSHPIEGERLDVGDAEGYLRAIIRYSAQSSRFRGVLHQEIAQLHYGEKSSRVEA